MSVFVGLTGMKHYFGTDFFKPGMPIRLSKDPDNPYDQEAIRAEVFPVGKVGYVANSSQTVPGGCYSAGRLYDKFEGSTFAVVRFIMKDTIIVEVVGPGEEIHLVKIYDSCMEGEELAPDSILTDTSAII